MTILRSASCIVLCLSAASSAESSTESSSSAIPVGGWSDWKYEYDPLFLPLPPEATIENAHGIAIQDDGTIIITYQDSTDPSKCLLRWNATKTDKVAEFLGPGETLCAGVPHGLRAAIETDDTTKNEKTVLYHANNEQALYKTDLNGEVEWTFQGPPDGSQPYRPTWFASQPGSPFVHLADGYGASNIYVFDKSNGTYTGKSFGGRGNAHGKFQTCHAISWDWRWEQMVVSDRENHRLEYFKVDRTDPSVFSYTHTVSFEPLLMRPCNIRVRQGDGAAIVPALEGTVGILNSQNEMVSLINITEALGDQGFLHPHDAHFLPGTSGDFVLGMCEHYNDKKLAANRWRVPIVCVTSLSLISTMLLSFFVAVTWNPGRVGYFRRQVGDGLDITAPIK